MIIGREKVLFLLEEAWVINFRGKGLQKKRICSKCPAPIKGIDIWIWTTMTLEGRLSLSF